MLPKQREKAAQLVLARIRDLNFAVLTPWSNRHARAKMLLQRLLKSD